MISVEGKERYVKGHQSSSLSSLFDTMTVSFVKVMNNSLVVAVVNAVVVVVVIVVGLVVVNVLDVFAVVAVIDVDS